MCDPERLFVGTNYYWRVPGIKQDTDVTVITNASRNKTLDIDARNRRYLITMAIRTACFLAFLVVPGWWKVLALAGAALLPVVVLLANASDNRPPPLVTPGDEEQSGTLALPGAAVIEGTVEEPE